eukprot:340774-Ditylum_brightwellii.AAC.1
MLSSKSWPLFQVDLFLYLSLLLSRLLTNSVKLVDGICLLIVAVVMAATGFLKGILDTLPNYGIELPLGEVVALLVKVAVVLDLT